MMAYKNLPKNGGMAPARVAFVQHKKCKRFREHRRTSCAEPFRAIACAALIFSKDQRTTCNRNFRLTSDSHGKIRTRFVLRERSANLVSDWDEEL
jgi:hypothetical protein